MTKEMISNYEFGAATMHDQIKEIESSFNEVQANIEETEKHLEELKAEQQNYVGIEGLEDLADMLGRHIEEAEGILHKLILIKDKLNNLLERYSEIDQTEKKLLADMPTNEKPM